MTWKRGLPKHRWTDEDAAFATAQWASGIHEREIAAIWGYSTTFTVHNKINDFMRKYTKLKPWQAEFSRLYKQGRPFRTEIFDSPKDCIANFVAQRTASHPVIVEDIP